MFLHKLRLHKLKEKAVELQLGFLLLACILLSGWLIQSCNEHNEQITQMKEEKPAEFYKKQSCNSKRAGSRPACWSEIDWQIYCQHVQCLK